MKRYVGTGLQRGHGMECALHSFGVRMMSVLKPLIWLLESSLVRCCGERLVGGRSWGVVSRRTLGEWACVALGSRTTC